MYVRQLSVNNKRKQIYIKMARSNNITLKNMGVLAGKKAIGKAVAGNYIKNSSGEWVKK
jgi:uncharacterized protein YdbL (DUF1318 family)|tara:strand:- start:663 stop:839 length:177 start_codon:yes stop_codon:yes gene_type:complete